MPEESKLFKDVFFKPAFLDEFSDALACVLPVFDKTSFRKRVFDKDWKDKELKQRVRHIVQVLHSFLPDDFPAAATVITGVVHHLQSQNIKEVSFGYMCLPEYIETYGLEHYSVSMKAIEKVTEFMSCEFVVRPFIIRYEDKMMKQMLKWSKSKSPKVRRLSCEGCRPRLPWAIALPGYKKSPEPIIPILENLKEDKDVWVRKSVANSLNDISKDNPALAMEVFKRWYGINKNTDWIVKHAARTLLKQGNPELMSMFGFGGDKSLKVEGFRVDTPMVKMGDSLSFSFKINNTSKTNKMIRLEYAMYYLRSNGSHSKKVFKISEKEYNATSKTTISRKQSFKPITTRVYYPGLHKVSVIVNGIEESLHEFTLTK